MARRARASRTDARTCDWTTLTFERPRETARARGATGGADGLIEAATFARDDVDRIGVWDDEANARKFCCSTDMAKRGLCGEGTRWGEW